MCLCFHSSPIKQKKKKLIHTPFHFEFLLQKLNQIKTFVSLSSAIFPFFSGKCRTTLLYFVDSPTQLIFCLKNKNLGMKCALFLRLSVSGAQCALQTASVSQVFYFSSWVEKKDLFYNNQTIHNFRKEELHNSNAWRLHFLLLKVSKCIFSVINQLSVVVREKKKFVKVTSSTGTTILQ